MALKTRRERHSAWLERLKPAGLVSSHVLEFSTGLEHRRQTIRRILGEVKPGEVVAAVARCCDHGEELVERIIQAGTAPNKLKLPNLSDEDIRGLQPLGAEYLINLATYRSKNWESYENPELAFARSVLGDLPNNAVNCKLPNNFVVKFVQVGMIWKRNES